MTTSKLSCIRIICDRICVCVPYTVKLPPICTSFAKLAPPAIVKAPPAVILVALLDLFILIPPERLKAPVVAFNDSFVFVPKILAFGFQLISEKQYPVL